MKRFATFLIVVCTAIIACAQTEHFKFMGIPLTGSITSFQQKLQAKGIKLDEDLNRALSVGTRAFKGRFSGYDALIAVYYDDKSMIVYRAKAVIETTSTSECERVYEEFKENLREKYKTTVLITGTQDEHENFFFFVDNDSKETIGMISVYVTKKDIYPYNQAIHVDYKDWANSSLHEDNKMDDL